jgi:formate dehydrogenase major subunit
MIHHVLENKLYDEDMSRRTPTRSSSGRRSRLQDGLQRFDEAKHKYDTKSWGYELCPDQRPKVAASLDDPGCIFTRMKKFFSRYTLDVGERITGIPAAQIRQIAETMAKNRPGTILYALGMTQHTTAVQGIRGFTILQLLLGNIGKPGGGVNALRGEPNVQGACDMGLLNNYMPGYLNYPVHTEPTLEAWTNNNGTAKRSTSQHAQGLLGRRGDAGERLRLRLAPQEERRQGLQRARHLRGRARRLDEVPLDRRPEPGGQLAQPEDHLRGMAKLEMIVVQELWETGDGRVLEAARRRPKTIPTEVLLLPASFFMEKNGSVTNSGAMVQWRHAAVKPPGQARPDGEILDIVYRRVRDLLKDSTDPKDDIVKKADWKYTTAEDVLREMNGRAVRDIPGTELKAGDLVSKTGDLKADGSTAAGVWIYAGVFSRGENLSKRRDGRTDPGGLGLYPNFGWTWPNNMRVLYNRASCDRNGKPYPNCKPIVWWDEAAGRWTGHDIPDVPSLTDGPKTPNGQRAFHMNAEGVGRLFAASYEDPDPKEEDLPRDAATSPRTVRSRCTSRSRARPQPLHPGVRTTDARTRASRDTSRSARSRTSPSS